MTVPSYSYLWDCVETKITELPELVSWCTGGEFASASERINLIISPIPMYQYDQFFNVDGGDEFEDVDGGDQWQI